LKQDDRPDLLVGSLIVGLLLLLLVALTSRPPEPVAATAPDDRFSAERATVVLRELLGDETPHPVGSVANRAVKRRLVALLEGLDVEVEEQAAIGCSLRGMRCAFVENVIATLPGKRRDALVLMAHYDSVPPAPGAGDDVAAVAALVEVLRIVRDGAPYENTLQLVLTDAEEQGLLGAEAFFGQHPSAADVKTVLNVEGSGSAGPVNLLRSTRGSGTLVRSFRWNAGYPVANSMATEIFARMPNDTDFTVAMQSEIKGLDFAFAGERNHYHTPLDTIDNLSQATLQHHGENVLPLVRVLADADLDAISGEYSYTTQLGFWISWPEAWTLPSAAVASVLLLVTIWLGRRDASLRKTLGGVGVAFLALVATIVANVAVLWVADRVAGTTPAWPAYHWPWRLLILGASLLGWIAVCGPLAWRAGLRGAWNGSWLVAAGLGLLLASYAPLAANPVLVPLLFAVVAGLAACVWQHETMASWWPHLAAVCAWVAVVYLGGLMPLLEASQGYGLAPAFYGPGALTLMLFSPLAAESSRLMKRGVAVFGLAAVAVGMVAIAVLPLYSEHRPQHLNFEYVQNLDEERAWWVAQPAGHLPSDVAAAADFGPAEVVLPGTTQAGPGFTAAAPWTAAASPELEVVRDEVVNGGREVVLRLSSPRDGDELQLLIHRESQLESLAVESREVEVSDTPRLRRLLPDHQPVSIVAPPAEGVELTLRLGSSDPHEHFLMDVGWGLPAAGGGLARAREPLAVPVHRGDRWSAYRRVRF
jgi:hypothetical protein